jgi:ADP-ribose pyrophosphatase
MEGIDEITTVSMEEFYEMLRSGQITDSFTLAAVLHAQARGYLSQVRQDH